MKILITGIGGQVGHFFRGFEESHDLLGTFHLVKPAMPFRLEKMDITIFNEVRNVVSQFAPDCIIHCAAATNVDRCEEEWDYAKTINIDGTRNVCEVAKEFGIKVVFVSTDYVFDGESGSYTEEDKTNPIQSYGRSKLIAEQFVRKLDNYVIARSGMVYSNLPNKFLDWIKKGIEEKNLTAVDEVHCCPTLAEELAECTIRLAEKDVHGLFNAVGAERISKIDFVKKVVTTLGHDPEMVKPIKQSDLSMPAKRLRDASLDISKILSEGITFSDMDGAMTKLKAKLNEG